MSIRGAAKAMCAVAATTLVLALSGCNVPNVAQQRSVEEARSAQTAALSPKVESSSLVQAGYLTVGLRTNRAVVPMCIEVDDSVLGYDVDVASALADELGLKVRFVPVTNVGKSLGSECDVVMDVSAEESGSSGKVVGSYAEAATAFFHRGDMGVANVEDLASKSVGLQGGSVSQKALAATSLAMTEKTFDNLNDAFVALSSGSIDYVLCDAYPGAYLACMATGVHFVGTLDAPTSEGVAVADANTKLQSEVRDALVSIQSDGRADVIRSRWVGGMPALSANSQIKNVPQSAAAAATAETSGGISTAGANASAAPA